MNLLDRHIFKSVLFTCAGAVGIFAFVLVLGNAVREIITPVLSGQLGYGVALQLILMLFPAVAPFALPMGVLTGVLLTLGRLSADSEVTAMRAAGISLPRLARPIFILAILGGLAGLYANFKAMPHGRLKYEKMLSDALRANPLTFIKPKTFIRDFKGYVIYVSEVGHERGAELHDCRIWLLDDKSRLSSLIHAESGHIDYDEKANELVLTLSHAQWDRRDRINPENFTEYPQVMAFEKLEPFHLSLDKIFNRTSRQKKLREMTYTELDNEEARVAALPFAANEQRTHDTDVMKVRLARAEKFNTALAVLSFALIGVPLGIRVSRRETTANLGVAVLLAVGYYFLTVMVGWLDRHPEYHPDLLLWVPNLLYLALGIRLFRRLELQ